LNEGVNVRGKMGGLQAVRIASCSTIDSRIGRDSPTGASKRTNVKPTLRVEVVRDRSPLDYNNELLSMA
jgi:hypothetical protein